jgi:hypothetical protein
MEENFNFDRDKLIQSDIEDRKKTKMLNLDKKKSNRDIDQMEEKELEELMSKKLKNYEDFIHFENKRFIKKETDTEIPCKLK